MYSIIEVSTAAQAKKFVSLPRILHKADPHFISPLDAEIAKIFDPVQNSFHSHGACARWLLTKENMVVGRIAAFVNFKKTTHAEMPLGGAGFFECINQQAAANLLFETAKKWLVARGMKGMEGPINFGENESWWGLLIHGFRPPSMGMNYNPGYYQTLFENYGWQKNYDQITNVMDLTIPAPERFFKIANWVMNKPGYTFKHFNIKQYKKFADDFKEIYNDAWADFENFTPITADAISDIFKRMKPIMDEKIIWFAYFENEPIAFVTALPDINQVLKHCHGKMDWWGKIKFLWYKKTYTINRIRMIVMGSKKKFQNKGIESSLIVCLAKEILPRKEVTDLELAWVGDFNTKMIAVHEATGAKLEKIHRTYKLLF